MSDTVIKISANMTRRSFMETTAIVAGGAALTGMPMFHADKVLAVPAVSDAPVLTFDSYFTGWPVYAFNGDAQPIQPPAAPQHGAALAAMSDEDFHRHYINL